MFHTKTSESQNRYLTLKRVCMQQSTTYVAGFTEEQDYVTYYVGIIRTN
jgi:hypothetical protein